MCLGVPGRVVELHEADGDLLHGVIEFGGVRRRVCLACVPEARPGDYVLVHAGVAINVVDPVEAQRVFAYLEQIGEQDGWGDSDEVRR